MNKVILKLSVLIVFAIWGCNNNATSTTNNSVESTKTTEKDAPINTKNIDTTTTSQGNASINDIDLTKINFSGTEPFWNIKFENDYAIYTSPVELDGIKVFYKKNIGDNNNLKLNDAITKISDKEYKLLGIMKKTKVEITIKNEKCSDGMSAENSTYKIILLRDKEKYEGCGSKK